MPDLIQPIRNRRMYVVSLATLLFACGAGAASFATARSFGSGSSVQAGGPHDAPPSEIGVAWPPYPPGQGQGQGQGRGPAHVDPRGPDVTPVPGATPDVSQPWWYVPYVNADAKKPLFAGLVNGVFISTDPEGPDIPCGDAAAADLSAADGRPLAIHPSYISPGTTPEPASNGQAVALCNGQLASAEARFSVAPDDSKGLRGGSFAIYRFRSSTARAQALAPADRWGSGTVNGIRAAVASPILADLGVGNSALVFYENGVVTRVTAVGLPLGLVQRIAEGIGN
jgi:hypothetical protein